ncbi:hypothetical protein C4K19_2176 [Pseudomonas chlororaphis subsp. aurantiaca]|nr:hypothetical protein C4K19_2176 [Pseudomonas chlororaphis subsp. aurantiaca]
MHIHNYAHSESRPRPRMSPAPPPPQVGPETYGALRPYKDRCLLPPIKCMKAKENHDTHCSLLISPQAEPDLAKSWELLLEKHGGSKKKKHCLSPFSTPQRPDIRLARLKRDQPPVAVDLGRRAETSDTVRRRRSPLMQHAPTSNLTRTHLSIQLMDIAIYGGHGALFLARLFQPSRRQYTKYSISFFRSSSRLCFVGNDSS